MTAATAPMKPAMTSHHHHSMSEWWPLPPPAPPLSPRPLVWAGCSTGHRSKLSCSDLGPVVELETRIHPKVHNHGEGPYWLEALSF